MYAIITETENVPHGYFVYEIVSKNIYSNFEVLLFSHVCKTMLPRCHNQM